MPTIRIVSTSKKIPSADALIVGVVPARTAKGDPYLHPDTPLPASTIRAINRQVATVGVSAKADTVTRLAAVADVAEPVIVAVGLGASADDTTLEVLRRGAGAAVRNLDGVKRLTVALPTRTTEELGAVTIGTHLGAYRFRAFLGSGSPKAAPPPARAAILVDRDATAADKQAVAAAVIVAESVERARDLVNTPPSALGPADVADVAESWSADLPIKVDVLDEAQLLQDGYGGICAVGQGSARPPRLVRMHYAPKTAVQRISLVGKGITFDSGGLSLKPPKAMETMKMDMGGAAAVIAATIAIARLKLPVEIITYAACAENMPSGTAQRPGDVLTTLSGRTVEVLNTDAEGRLVLCDALTRALEDEPDVIIDAATLTGAQIVALGPRVSAVMANDDDLRTTLVAAADSCGDACWPMPLPPELRASLDSKVADIANVGDRLGGMLIAGLFLKEFVPDTVPWAHLDIAGPAFNESAAYGYTPAGGTGAGVRVIVQAVQDLCDRTG